MPPIDYSKWDNIDTDSDWEPDTSSVARPQLSKPTVPSPTAPSTATQATPSNQTPSSPEGTVKAVTVRCQGDKGIPWSATTIPSNHPIFANSVPPVPALLDFPIVIHRIGTADNGTTGCLDNQAITYIHVDPITGFAPPKWQSGIGTVIVARKDKKDLSPEHYEAIWMYCDRILDYFGEGEGAPEHLYSRKAFERWFVGYQKEVLQYGRKEWTSVPPLYEE